MADQNKIIEEIRAQLDNVIDPELLISIVDLGLVYDVNIAGQKANIVMTLTTIGCPLFSIIEKDVKKRVLEVDGVEDVYVELVFDPPWSLESLSERGKAVLGI